MAGKENDDTPNEIKEMAKYYKIKDAFAEYASNVKLPILSRKSILHHSLNPKVLLCLLIKMLSEGFDLNVADKTINFARTEAEARMIDLGFIHILHFVYSIENQCVNKIDVKKRRSWLKPSSAFYVLDNLFELV